MVFSNPVFICLFLPAVLLINVALSKRLKNTFLLFVSLLFYAWGEPKCIIVLVGSIVVNYLIALAIGYFNHRETKSICKAFLAVAVLFNLGVLFVFKYADFTLRNINRVLHFLSFDSIALTTQIGQIALPIGISFFTFQSLSYVVETYRGESVQKNPINLGLYISFFPQLVAGPIVRYTTIAEQLTHRTETLEGFSYGAERFIIGLAKKILIANTVAVVADHTFSLANQGYINCGLAWFGALCYALQIYFDFSGYSDMAIGLGRMFGFHFLENFDYPYTARSISDFWHRWHISLSTWFRDYVYIPLGGSRVSKGKWLRNLFIVWLLTGIWHGAKWTFIVWGLLYFVVLAFEKLTNMDDLLQRNQTVAFVYRFVTLLVVMFCWVVFRADSIVVAGRYIKCMLAMYGAVSCSIASKNMMMMYGGSVAITAFLSFPLLRKLFRRLLARLPVNLGLGVRYAALLCLLLISLATSIASTYNPFIYFNF